MNGATPDTGSTYGGIARELIPWFPTIDPERCDPVGCGQACIAACPQHVYEQAENGRVIVARPNDCTVGDISCSVQCPQDAINFPSQRELRRLLKELRQRIE